MKKLILTLFLITIHHSFYAQSSDKISREIRSEVDKTISENKKEEKKILDRYYTTKITTYGTNLIEYNKAYENYYHFINTYLVKNETIVYLHEKGKSAKVSSGRVKENVSYGDLFEVEYYFIDKSKGYKYEKRISLYKGNDVFEKQKELDNLEYTITEIGNSDYDSIYKFYESDVKGK